MYKDMFTVPDLEYTLSNHSMIILADLFILLVPLLVTSVDVRPATQILKASNCKSKEFIAGGVGGTHHTVHCFPEALISTRTNKISSADR